MWLIRVASFPNRNLMPEHSFLLSYLFKKNQFLVTVFLFFLGCTARGMLIPIRVELSHLPNCTLYPWKIKQEIGRIWDIPQSTMMTDWQKSITNIVECYLIRPNDRLNSKMIFNSFWPRSCAWSSKCRWDRHKIPKRSHWKVFRTKCWRRCIHCTQNGTMTNATKINVPWLKYF